MEDLALAQMRFPQGSAYPSPHPVTRFRAPDARECLAAYGPDTRGREFIEQFIREEFLAHFNARVTACMPTLLAMHEPGGAVRAAAGIRCAAQEPLFLETYTHRPIEQVIATALGADVPREAIVEVGNLACRNGRAAMELVTALVPALLDRGYAWVVFTGADTVRNVFKHLRLQPQALCIANKALLGAAQYDWGSYYDHHPIVMAGRLLDGVESLDMTTRIQ